MPSRPAAVLLACATLAAAPCAPLSARPNAPAEAPSAAAVEHALDQDRVEEAVALARGLAAARPDDPAALALLGRALALSRRFGEAAEVLERAVELGAGDVRTLLFYGSALWEAGRPEAAEPVLAGAAEAAAGTGAEALARHQLGRLRLWLGRPAEALAPLERAAALRPGDADVRLDLARALERAGRLEEAIAAFRAVVELAPESHHARWGLAQALRRAGREEESAAELEAYRRLQAAEQERVRREQLEREAEARRARGDRAEEGPPEAEDGPLRRDLGAPPAAAGGPENPACRLRDVAAEAGLDFVHDRGTSPRKHLAETMGAGVAWLDYDGDGWSDLYAVQSGPFPPGSERPEGVSSRLFRNLGPQRDRPGGPGGAGGFAFEDATAAAGVGDRGYGMGAVAADADGDGDPDLLVTGYGGLAFYRNRGDGTFEEATEEAGLALDGWSSSAAFADADGDSDLDLYVARYVEFPEDLDLFCGDPETGERRYCDPSMFEGAHDRFFVNRGPGSGGTTFTDATEAAGLGGANGRGLGVLFTDLDGDGAPDLYVANDLTVNFLFRNLGPRSGSAPGPGGEGASFEDLSLLSGAAVNAEGKPEAGMGLAAADFDGDGDPDLAVTNFDVETNTLYENQGQMQFADRSAASGFGPPSFNLLGFGLVADDFDGDGDLDAYAANGHIFERPSRPEIGYAQRDLLLLGDGRGRFRELRCPGLEADPQVGRGLAAADFDRDGDPDLAVSNNDGPLQLLASELPGLAGGGIGVRLAGAGANREGVGAVVTLVTSGGRRSRWVTAGDSYQSASDRPVVFAAPAGERLEALEVRWPSGKRQRLEAPPAGTYLTVLER